MVEFALEIFLFSISRLCSPLSMVSSCDLSVLTDQTGAFSDDPTSGVAATCSSMLAVETLRLRVREASLVRSDQRAPQAQPIGLHDFT